MNLLSGGFYPSNGPVSENKKIEKKAKYLDLSWNLKKLLKDEGDFVVGVFETVLKGVWKNWGRFVGQKKNWDHKDHRTSISACILRMVQKTCDYLLSIGLGVKNRKEKRQRIKRIKLEKRNKNKQSQKYKLKGYQHEIQLYIIIRT